MAEDQQLGQHHLVANYLEAVGQVAEFHLVVQEHLATKKQEDLVDQALLDHLEHLAADHLEVLEQLVRYQLVDQEQLVTNHLEDLDHMEKAHQEVPEVAFHS